MSTGGVFVTSFYSSLLYGAINVAVDEFGIMLVGEGYKPDLVGHTRRSDVTHEITGGGYSGPVKTTVELIYDDDGIKLKFGGARWPRVDIRPRGAIYFKANGGDPSEDQLFFFHDFGKVFQCTDGAFIVEPLTLELK